MMSSFVDRYVIEVLPTVVPTECGRSHQVESLSAVQGRCREWQRCRAFVASRVTSSLSTGHQCVTFASLVTLRDAY